MSSEVAREGNRRRNKRWKENNPEHVAALDRKKSLAHYYRNHDAKKKQQREKGKQRWNAMSPDERKDRNLRQLYGITLIEFNAKLEAQQYRCACCGGDNPGTRGWMVDHCHRQGHVRGILCSHCNTGLGMAKDSVEILEKWITYLRR